jgi:predicted aspartyl protease
MARHRFPPGTIDPRDLEKFGPRLEIEVGSPIIHSHKNSDLMASSSVLESRKVCRMAALIDTGASRTVLTPQAIQRLDLPLVDYTTVSRAGGLDRTAVHAASFRFPRYKLATIELIQVLCCELPEQPIQCLLGRDILSRWAFAYDGKSGEWIIDEEHLAAWIEPSLRPHRESQPAIFVEPSSGVYEVFVSHASEDKAFVEPLVSALKASGISVWYDKDRMQWGDNLRGSIDQGLLNSRFAIVVLSKAFFRKKRWTEHELNGLFARERDGKTKILPIWHGVTQDDIGEYSPAFVDRIALDSQKDSIEDIIRHLESRLERNRRRMP